MNSTQTLSGSHLRTYNTIFQHPISHNLEWRAVCALLKQVGQIAEEPNGHLKATRNGQTLILHKPHTKDIAEDRDVMALRHFLEHSETIPPETDAKAAHWLLVIDHHEARVYRSEIHGAQPGRILPHDVKEHFNQVQDAQEVSRGKEKPDPNSFFEPVAKALQAAGQILIFGTGTGSSSEMGQFITWLKTNHPEMASRIIGSLAVDEQHLTKDQILAKAREFYANADLSPAGNPDPRKTGANVETNLT
jgi:hypothetical protein